MFWKKYLHWKQFTFNSQRFMERIMALQQMTDKKKHIFGDLVSVISKSCAVSFYPKQILSSAPWRLFRRKQSLKNDRFIWGLIRISRQIWNSLWTIYSLSALETINSGKTHQYSVDILCNWLSPPASSTNWKVTGAIRALNSALNDWNI